MIKPPVFALLACLASSVSFSQITGNSFASKVDLQMGANPSFVSVNDFDGDGKSDLAAVTFAYFSVFRNTTTAGAINSSSFAARQDFATAASTLSSPTIVSGDLDGDNKPDVITPQFIANGSPAVFSVFRNTSTSGNVSFDTRQDFATSSAPNHVTLKDMDEDGKLDLICTMWWLHTVRVYRNTSTPGNISFDMSFFSVSTGANSYPGQLACEDYDQDGKVDIAVSNQGNSTWGLFRNTGSAGNLNFTSSGTLTMSSPFAWGVASDIDGDNKPDLIGSIWSGSIGIFRNTSTSNTISFSSQLTFSTTGANGPGRLSCADFDLDSRMDIVVGNANTGNVSVFKNFSTPGTINSNSLPIRKEFTTGSSPAAHVADIDGDGKQDIVTANAGSSSLSVLRNTITPSHDLVAHYSFTGNTGDSSGYENHATKYAGATLSADREGVTNRAYNFDGTSSAYAQAPASASLNTATMNNFFASAWINPASGTTGQPNGTVWMLLQSNNTNYSLVHHLNTNQVSFQNFNGVNFATTSVISKKILSRNQWYHVAFRLDSTNRASLFIDGVLDTSIVITPVKPVSPALTIGKNPSAGVPNNWAFLGKIDEVRVYRRYVTDNEIVALYNKRTIYYSKSSGNLNQLGTWGTNNDGSGTSPLSFDSSNVTYYVRNNVNPVTGGSLKITGANSILVLGDGTNPFNLAVGASDTLSCDSIYMNNNITLTVSGRVISSKMGAGTSATAQYIGTSSPQYIAAGRYTNLLVNGNGADKTLTGNTTVTNNFVMITTVNTLTHTLTLGTGTTNTGTLTRNAGTVNGRFARWFAPAANTGISGLFPVGTASRYAPFQLNFTSASVSGGKITCEFIASDPGNTGFPVPDFSNGFIFLDKAAIDGYWKVSGTNTTDEFSVAATINNFTGVNNYLDLRVVRRNPNGSWVASGNHVTNTGSNTSAVINRSGLTNVEGEYGIAGDKSVNPLPVTWLSFNGKQAGDHVELNWNTASEINNKGFDVQRSVDGKYFETIGFVKGNGSTKLISRYAYTDKDAFTNKDGILYYRLRQLDVNGATSFSNSVIVSKVPSLSSASFSVYPNPSAFTITIKGLEQPASVYDATGNLVMIIETNGTSDISTLANGIYFIRSGAGVQKLVKQ